MSKKDNEQIEEDPAKFLPSKRLDLTRRGWRSVAVLFDGNSAYWLLGILGAMLIMLTYQVLDSRYVRIPVFKEGLENLDRSTSAKLERVQYENQANNAQVKDKLNELTDQGKEMRSDLKTILYNMNKPSH